jgi:hypothetical protein
MKSPPVIWLSFQNAVVPKAMFGRLFVAQVRSPASKRAIHVLNLTVYQYLTGKRMSPKSFKRGTAENPPRYCGEVTTKRAIMVKQRPRPGINKERAAGPSQTIMASRAPRSVSSLSAGECSS